MTLCANCGKPEEEHFPGRQRRCPDGKRFHLQHTFAPAPVPIEEPKHKHGCRALRLGDVNSCTCAQLAGERVLSLAPAPSEDGWLTEGIRTKSLEVCIQENGIIRNRAGRLIGRLVDGIEFDGPHTQEEEK